MFQWLQLFRILGGRMWKICEAQHSLRASHCYARLHSQHARTTLGGHGEHPSCSLQQIHSAAWNRTSSWTFVDICGCCKAVATDVSSMWRGFCSIKLCLSAGDGQTRVKARLCPPWHRGICVWTIHWISVKAIMACQVASRSDTETVVGTAAPKAVMSSNPPQWSEKYSMKIRIMAILTYNYIYNTNY